MIYERVELIKTSQLDGIDIVMASIDYESQHKL